MNPKHLVLILLIIDSSLLYAGSIHYYDLEQRPAAEVIPLIQPFLEPGEVINGDGYQLFIKASDARANQLKGLIANIDKPISDYKISVSNDQSLLQSRQSVSGSIRIESGDATIEAGELISEDSSAEVRVESSNRNKQSGQTQHLRVQQGKAAFITTANLRIIPVQYYPNGAHLAQEIYPTSQDGFFIIVRSANNKMANIEIQSAASNKTGNNVYHNYGQEQTFVNTTLQAPLNSWFELGGINENSSSHSSEILSRSQSSKQTGNSILLKIEQIN